MLVLASTDCFEKSKDFLSRSAMYTPEPRVADVCPRRPSAGSPAAHKNLPLKLVQQQYTFSRPLVELALQVLLSAESLTGRTTTVHGCIRSIDLIGCCLRQNGSRRMGRKSALEVLALQK